jgi:ubiquinone/menaquinone biosynthesis C-methylase UbiE
MAENWDDKFDYLSGSRSLYHNEDYWRFLVREVWRIADRPCKIVDFGCGFGWGGLFLMPLLAPASEYTGVDLSAPLLDRGRAIFANLPYRSRFIRGDATSTPLKDGEFDVAFAHTLMMHLPRPEKALAEMIRVTRGGGLVIACECSRNAINALIHVDETDEQEHSPLGMLQAMNANIRRRTGIDYNIGMKMPVMMHRAGLRNVEARLSDAVRLVFPPLDTPQKERAFKAICDDGLGTYPTDDASFAATLAALTERGAGEREAAKELRREMKNDYRRRGRDYHFVHPGLMTISFGTVAKG